MNVDRLNHQDEDGQVTLLVVGLFAIVLLVVAVAVDASAAYLHRQGLASLADATALAAADGVKAEQAYAGALDESTPIDPARAHEYAADHLEQVGAEQRYDGLSLVVDVDGSRVIVRLEAEVDLPIAPPDWEDRPKVTGVASAYVVVGN